MVVLSPRLPTLAVATWLSFADLAPEWSGGPDQVVVAGASAGQVAGGWQLNPTDRISCADVNRDGRAEVLIYQGDSGYDWRMFQLGPRTLNPSQSKRTNLYRILHHPSGLVSRLLSI